jgi:IS30 family transposase
VREYNQLSFDERKELFVLKNEGKGVNEIGKKLGRSGSTISRELKRNTNDKRVGYLPDAAHNLSRQRKEGRKPKLEGDIELQKLVISQLKTGWSPEVIAGRMKQENAKNRVSHETIYAFVYGEIGQTHQLHKLLLRARPKRRKLVARKPRSAIPERVSIHDRPEVIETRQEFGNLEGDLTFFEGNQSMNIGVVVERKSRFTMLMKNVSKHSAVVMKNIFNLTATLPEFARKSITFDNGLEFARHTLLKRCLSMQTFFCDKHAPWQKGQVEQMNCMLHRYLPKNSNLEEVSDEQITLIQNLLNNRPRKCLGFKTPNEVFFYEINQAVALQT